MSLQNSHRGNLISLGKNKWYFLNTGVHDGLFNMSCDEFLLNRLINKAIELPVLRVYSWSESTFSIGANQNIDLDFLSRDKKIPIVKRLSGGMAVLHGTPDIELTYSVVLYSEGSFKSAYYKIGDALIYFVQNYGLEASYGYSSDGSYFKDFNCFTSKTNVDIVANDTKIIGSAQYRRKGFILQHGSIKLDLISEITGKCINFTEASNVLKSAFEVKLDIDFEDYCISDSLFSPQMVRI